MNKRGPLILAFTLVGALVGLIVSRNALLVAGLALAGGVLGATLPIAKVAGVGPQLGFLDYAWRLIPANPILLRVVESGGKRRRDLFIRCGYLGLLVFLVIFSLMSSGSSTAGTDLSALAKESAAIFQRMSYLQLGLVSLLAPIFTAGAITQEKDSQTYDILLSTPLTNGQIVLGSLMSRLFFVVALLISGIPVFSITQIFGGVAIKSIVQSFGIAAATAFVTGALAMAIAVFKVGTRRTIFSFYLFVVIYLVGGYLLDKIPQLHITLADKVSTSTTSWLTGIHPFLALEAIFNDPHYTPPDILSLPENLRGWPIGTYLSHPAQFYTSFMFLLSFVLVTPSIVLLRRLAQSTTSFKGAILKKLRITRGDQTRKPRYVWANPIAWREAKTKASAARATVLRYGFMAAGVIGAFILLWQFATLIQPPNFIDDTSYNPSAGLLTVYSTTGEPRTLRLPPGTSVKYGGNEIQLEQLRGKFAVVATEKRLGPASPAPAPGRPGSPLAAGAAAQSAWATVVVSEIGREMSDKSVRSFLLGMVIVEFAVILLIVTNAAASTVTREKEDGTLDILLTSPITSRYYIWGKLRGLVSFVLPLIMVPTVSVLLFIVYDFWRRTTFWDDPNFKWIVLPEAVVLMPAMLIIVTAFAAIVGMQMSLRCRTTVMAVMTSVGIVVGVCAALGWCGYTVLAGSGNEIGMVIGSFSPFTILTVLIDPYEFAGGVFNPNPGQIDNSSGARFLMCAFTVIAVGAYTAVVWSMYRSMVKNFDMTIRRQSR
jgi:ABC-type transport system involved in multi-copper enzyme maturation permease subunit